ncbi:hypothetical protein [Bordetella genomosp. 13]|uniref:hypothetical protein n=1 Tax=Bordetella genomosp. 13 TaxID=463040 RepID=UPI00119E09E5|nr:hypothetical protein [Bordetella genomosp. 13]
MKALTLTAAALTLSTLFGAVAQAADNVEPNNVPFQGVYGRHDAGSTRAQVQAAPDAGLARAQARTDLAQGQAHAAASNVEPNNVPFQGVYRPARSHVASAE